MRLRIEGTLSIQSDIKLVIIKSQKKYIFPLILALAAASYLFTLTPALTVAGDDIGYIILAQSLVSGNGYRDLHLPGSPRQSKTYPALPLMLAALMLIFSQQAIIAFKLLSSLSLLSALIIFYLLLRGDEHIRDELFISASALLLAFNPYLLASSNRVLTELPYTALSLFIIFIFQKYFREKTGITKNFFFLCAISLSIILLFYLRGIGIALLLAVLAYMALRKEFKQAAVVACLFILGISVYLYRDTLISGHGSWQHYFMAHFVTYNPQGTLNATGFFFHRSLLYACAYATTHIADLFFYPFLLNITQQSPLFGAKLLAGVLLFMFIAYGFVLQARRRLSPQHIYTVIYIVLISMFSVRGERYLVPLLPLFIYYLMTSVTAFGVKRALLASFLVLGLFFINAAGDTHVIYNERYKPYSSQEVSYLSCSSWIKDNTSGKSIILCRKPQIIYFQTGRQSNYYPVPVNFKELKHVFQNKQAEYFIIDSFDSEVQSALLKFIALYKDNFDLVFSTAEPVCLIYKFKEDKLLK